MLITGQQYTLVALYLTFIIVLPALLIQNLALAQELEDSAPVQLIDRISIETPNDILDLSIPPLTNPDSLTETSELPLENDDSIQIPTLEMIAVDSEAALNLINDPYVDEDDLQNMEGFFMIPMGMMPPAGGEQGMGGMYASEYVEEIRDAAGTFY